MRTLLALLNPAALSAQMLMVGGMAQGRPTSFQDFLRQLRGQPATLVVLEDKDTAWGDSVRRLRRQEPLVALNPKITVIPLAQKLGEELRTRHGWPKDKSRWAWMDTRGRVAAEGATLPRAKELFDAFEGAGLRPRTEGLRRFLREHPGHAEAQAALLQELKAIAELRFREYTHWDDPAPRAPGGLAVATSSGFDFSDGLKEKDAPAPPGIETLAIPSDVDQRIWGEYAEELARTFEDPEWGLDEGLAGLPMAYLPIRPPFYTCYARYSPVCTTLSERVFPKVEAALRAQPESGFFWDCWIGFAAPLKRALIPFLDTLTPSPNVKAEDWPPGTVRRAWFKECRERLDWPALAAAAKPLWEALADTDEVQRRFEDSRKTRLGMSLLSQNQWEGLAEPYLEALLSLGRTGDAERLVSDWSGGRGWPGAFPRAAALASRTGHEALSRKWEQLKGE